MTSVILSQQVDYPLKTLFIGIYKYVTVKLPVNVLSKRLKLLFVESHMFCKCMKHTWTFFSI